MRIKSLHIYPVKSARGIDLDTALVKPRGLANDRRYMLVDQGGKFITQREYPQLARLLVRRNEDRIDLSWPNQKWINVPYTSNTNRKKVVVWRSTVDAATLDSEVNAELSKWLGRTVTLVFMDKTAERLASEKWTASPSPVSFADGYPILITNTASLTLLNNHIINTGGEALDMDRFRPNIVIDCDQPWAEDNWKSVQIGEVILDLVKPCARCIMTSIDQNTGEKHKKTALAALKNLHPSTDSDNPGVLFGWNAVPRNMGTINIDDIVKTRSQ